MAGKRQLVLVLALHVPFLGRQFTALAHRQAGPRFGHPGELGFEEARPKAEQRPDAIHEGMCGVHVEQHAAIRIRVDDRRIADRVGAAGDAGLDLAKGDLVRDLDGGFDAGAAGALQVVGRGPNRKPRFDDALACEIPVTGVLDDGAEGDFPECLSLEVQLVDETVECTGHQVLVGQSAVHRVRATKRNACPAYYSDSNGVSVMQHALISFLSRRARTLHHSCAPP